MRVQLISHACVILWTKAGGILTDPWLTGKAFNDSWALWPEAAFDEALLPEISYLWISHEHPDHFHIPTLRSLPDDFKQRVIVLFQEKNSDKLFDAMRKMGFRRFRALPNRETVALAPSVAVNCCQIGFIDSVLSVRDGDTTVVNINDCDLGDADIRRIQADVGRPQILLNQFSIAGFDGYTDRAGVLPRMARQKLDGMIHAHRMFGADRTIPFASFCYFCTADNWYVNEHANSVAATAQAFEDAGCAMTLLYPGDCAAVGEPWDNAAVLERFKASADARTALNADEPATVSEKDLDAGFQTFCGQLHDRYPSALVASIGSLRFRLIDHKRIMTCDFRRRTATFEPDTGEPDAGAPDTGAPHTGRNADIALYAQPLLFGFIRPFGFETLAVAGRFTVENNRRRWRRLKILSILNNQEIYLRPRLLTRRTMAYIAHRLANGLLHQIRQKAHQRAAQTKQA